MIESVTLVKLGGGLITDKTQPESCHQERLTRLARELSELSHHLAQRAGRLLVAHGSGSFGHAAAHGSALDRFAAISRDRAELRCAVGRTQDAAARLHRRVVSALLESHDEVYSLAPSSYLTFAAEPASLVVETSAPLRLALELGMLAVTYGDVLMDEAKGARIASTEEVFDAVTAELVKHGFRFDRCLWLGETAGILRPDGTTAELIDASNIEQARLWVAGSHGVDVTGGMRLRLETAWAMAKRGIESWILDGRVEGVLSPLVDGHGSLAGTRVSL